MSTRAVTAAAHIQAPAIYRLIGDMQGLLDAVAVEGFRAHLNSKLDRPPSIDPVEELRAGWDRHVAFGLANPALYRLMYGEPRAGDTPPAAADAKRVLGSLIHRIAEVARLRIGEEHATGLVQAAGRGTTLTLIDLPAEDRDLELSDIAREAVLAAIISDAPTAHEPGPISAAVALRAVLPQTSALTDHERGLMDEWLDRITDVDRPRR